MNTYAYVSCMYVHLFTSRKVTLCQGNNLSLKKLNN